MDVGIWKIEMSAPNDVSDLSRLMSDGSINPADIVAIIGKTEGNGGANDFTRGFATDSFLHLLSKHLNISPDEVADKILFIWSGGTEGVLSPHATVFTRSKLKSREYPEARLAIGIGMSRQLRPEEIGTCAHVDEVAATVALALADAGINHFEDVHFVQVKGPLLTPSAITDATLRGASTVTSDPNASKRYARGAMALGVGVALGEIAREDISDGAIASNLELYSNVASTSAGGELSHCEVFLLGNSPRSSSAFRIGHARMSDAIDADGVLAAIRSAGLNFGERPSVDQAPRIVSVFAKAEASPTGRIRGRRTTMLSDADINYERHARAAVGAVIASVTFDPAIFVSGGAEHQCEPGMAPIAAIVKL